MERDIDGGVSFWARLEKLGIAVLHSGAGSDSSGPVVSRSLSLFQSWNGNFPFLSFPLSYYTGGMHGRSYSWLTFGKGPVNTILVETRSSWTYRKLITRRKELRHKSDESIRWRFCTVLLWDVSFESGPLEDYIKYVGSTRMLFPNFIKVLGF